MGIEIERKFLVANDGWKRRAKSSKNLTQGYIARNEKASIRVRLIDKDKAVLTLKGPRTPRSRTEFEYRIPRDEAEELLAICGETQVSKVRHKVRHAGKTWEIDVFQGRHAGLVLAEIELDHEDETFAFPEWLGVEVTTDPRFTNASLAAADALPTL